MNEDEAREIVRGLRSELAAARETVVAARRRADALTKVVEGYLELFPNLAESIRRQGPQAPSETPAAAPAPKDDQAPSETTDYPRGQDAVLRILKADEFRGRYWTINQIADELYQRGWPPRARSGEALDRTQGLHSVRAAVARLAESGQVHRGIGDRGHVVFYYQHPGTDPPAFRSQPKLMEDGKGSGS